LTNNAEKHDWWVVGSQAAWEGSFDQFVSPLVRVPRISVGRGSFSSTANQVVTNLASNMSPVKNISISTAGKIMTSDTLKGAPSAVLRGGLDTPAIKSALSVSAQATLNAFVNLLKSIGL
jgi:hypothetical protein